MISKYNENSISCSQGKGNCPHKGRDRVKSWASGSCLLLDKDAVYRVK